MVWAKWIGVVLLALLLGVNSGGCSQPVDRVSPQDNASPEEMPDEGIPATWERPSVNEQLMVMWEKIYLTRSAHEELFFSLVLTETTFNGVMRERVRLGERYGTSTLEDVTAYFRDGYMAIETVFQSGPLVVRPTIWTQVSVRGGKIAANTEYLVVGAVPLPGLLREDLGRTIEKALEQPLPYNDVEVLGVRVEHELLSVFGKTRARPS